MCLCAAIICAMVDLFHRGKMADGVAVARPTPFRSTPPNRDIVSQTQTRAYSLQRKRCLLAYRSPDSPAQFVMSVIAMQEKVLATKIDVVWPLER